LSLLTFVKAMAYFRGDDVVTIEDVRQILPFVLHDKLTPDSDSPFFNAAGNGVYRVDRISWIRKLFDLACAEYDRLDLDRDDPVGELERQFAAGLDGVAEAEVRNRLVKIERLLGEWSKGRKMYGHLYDDILKLKYLHQRYTNYRNWLKWQA
jgi:MoxR-like ATPase